MLLILSIRESKYLDRLVTSLKSSYTLPVTLLTLDKFVKYSSLSLYYDTDLTFNKTFTIDEETFIDFNNVKTCFLSNYPFIAGEWIPYENHYDKLYALQEWTATLNALLLTSSSTKFVNPYLIPYDLNSELEHVLVLQKFNIDTVDMILTNIPRLAANYYENSYKSVVYKAVQSGYNTASSMELADLGRLNKLNLSPAIFQKGVNGIETTVCLLGKNVYAVEADRLSSEAGYKPVEITDELVDRLYQVSDHLNCPWIFFHFLYEPDTGKYYAYGLNIIPDFDLAVNTLGESFIDAMAAYLAEEYAK